MFPTMFQVNLPQEKKFKIDFQDGGHVRYLMRMILAILIYKSPLYFLPSFESMGLS